MNNQTLFFTYDATSKQRLDIFLLSVKDNFSRSYIQKLITNGHVKVNGNIVAKNYVLRFNDTISLNIPPLEEIRAFAQYIPLEIVYEDDDIIIINKSKGMVVHPCIGHPDNTLVNALLHHCKGNLSGINGAIRPGIVHRIDKDTSGLLIVAKNDISHSALSFQLKDHLIKREYHAIVYGAFKNDCGTINFPIGRDVNDRKKMSVTSKNSKEAITNYYVLDRANQFSYVKFLLQTGRTHQIRVHSAYMGHPLAGDVLYGPKKVIKELQGQCLHAKKLSFTHPSSKEFLNFNTQLPEYFTRFLNKIGISVNC